MITSFNMGIDVLAEVVENVNQVKFLKKHHSKKVQGYYFSQPLSEEDFSGFLGAVDN